MRNFQEKTHGKERGIRIAFLLHAASGRVYRLINVVYYQSPVYYHQYAITQYAITIPHRGRPSFVLKSDKYRLFKIVPYK